MAKGEGGLQTIRRGAAALRALAASGGEGLRLGEAAAAIGCTRPTTHRILAALVAEGLVEQRGGERRYHLSVDFFALAARAGGGDTLRSLGRAALIRLSQAIGDSTFLLVRAGYDAVCLDREEGPFPVRTLTGDIGGRVILGRGPGSLALLAHLPDAERREVIRYNIPRLTGILSVDEIALELACAEVREQGYAVETGSIYTGMAGVAVPVLDAAGRIAAVLSIGTLTDRVTGRRLPAVVEQLQAEAAALGARLNPFDPTLRRPLRPAPSETAA